MKNDDAELIQRTLAGDPHAFSGLVRKYQKQVHALCWRKIDDFHIAEEITQDVFLRVYEKLSTLKDPSRFVGWLYVIATNECLAWLKKKRVPMESLDAIPPEELEELAYAQYHAAQQEEEVSERHRDVVKRLLQKLPGSERTVVTLHYLGEMSCEEISKFLGVSPNTVKSRLHRARNRLKKKQQMVREVLGGSKGGILMSGKLKDIRSKFDSFMEQVRAHPFSGADILMEACDEIENALKGDITPELAHLAADDIYPYMGKLGYEKCISLHRGYLGVAPNNAERFWAHSQLVMNLAMLRRNTETIEEQTRLYRWAGEHLSNEYVLETLVPLEPANCWKEEGRIDEWFQLYDDASERLEQPKVSRYRRCDFLQTGAEVSLFNDRLDEALLGMEKLERANNEPSSEYYFRFWLAVMTTRLLVHSKRKDWRRFDQVFTEARTFLDEAVEKRKAGQPVAPGELAWFSHDIGVCLMWSKKYNEAQRFLQIAIDANDDPGTRFFLAATVWASEKHREKTLHHLKVAQHFARSPFERDMFLPQFLETSEFSDVKEDKEFLRVLGQKSDDNKTS